MNRTTLNIQKFILPLIVLISVGSSSPLYSQNAALFLKSGKSIEGRIIQETNDSITLANDLGEIKIRRIEVEKIYYSQLPNTTGIADSLLRQPLNDHVVVHLKNGEVIDGLLIAKSPTMIMVQADLGRLTVPKQDVRLVEYVSEAFAERGEAVRLELTTGKKIDGYLYSEDRNSLTLITNLGRLSIDKKDLRSIDYGASVKFRRPELKQEFATATTLSSFKETLLHRRQDTFEAGFSSQFGENYSTGGIFGYRNRYNLKTFQTFSLNLAGNLTFAAFTLNKNIISDATIPGQIEATGAAIVTTLGVGTPIHLYPTEGAAYEFFLAPILETYVIYKTLKKTYPSFPSLDSEIRSTDFRFGLANRVGMEWSFGQKWKAGLSFNIHFIFGESDYNSFNLHLGTRLY
ncbi:MAG: hypothetical protein MUC94_09510 [bacterium]|nr:hypothetical protein [bacterium]